MCVCGGEVGWWREGVGGSVVRYGSLSPSHTCAHTHTYICRDNLEDFILFSPSSVSVVSDTVNLSQFPPLIIIKKRKLLHSPLNTPTCLLLLLAVEPLFFFFFLGPPPIHARLMAGLLRSFILTSLYSGDKRRRQRTPTNREKQHARTERFTETAGLNISISHPTKHNVVLNKGCCASSNGEFTWECKFIEKDGGEVVLTTKKRCKTNLKT